MNDEGKADEEHGLVTERAKDIKGVSGKGEMNKDDTGAKSCSDRFVESWSTGLEHMRTATIKELTELKGELYDECYPSSVFDNEGEGKGGIVSTIIGLLCGIWKFLYVPHFPAFHRPGWLVKIALGPYDSDWLEAIGADLAAGLTVAMTLIPQALSYATLANQPPINGLYASVLPCAAYVCLGSSMTLALGPVAIVGLLVGSLVSKYNIEVASAEAVDFASEVCVIAGVILITMSLLNLGNFIRFISHPVMSGFTTAAAMLIGLNQIKGAFGFKTIGGYYPQTGDGKAHYNYEVMEWIQHHFGDTYTTADIASVSDDTFTGQEGESIRNPYAAAICFGLYVPLILNQTMKKRFKPTAARKSWWVYKVWIYCSNMSALIAVVVGGLVAMNIKRGASDDDFYANTLKIVGSVPPGLNIMRTPSMKWDFFTLLPDVLPLTLIAFMESYSIAKKTATMTGTLGMLSPSQELFAVGTSNIMGALSSSFPVAGSYSRSSINFSAGARSPLSKITTLLVVILALLVLTESFYYIPYAALSAIIWVGITNLIDIRDFWNAWKYSKKDFVTMTITFLVTLIFETSIGLGVGLVVSILIFLAEVSFSRNTKPRVVHEHTDNDGILVVKLEGDLTFLSSFRMKDLLLPYTILERVDEEEEDEANEQDEAIGLDLETGGEPPRVQRSVSADSNVSEGTKLKREQIKRAERLHKKVEDAFDYVIPPPEAQKNNCVPELPLAVILDLSQVKLIDITGLHSLAEFSVDARSIGILVAIVNTTKVITAQMVKFGITSDISNDKVNIDEYVLRSRIVQEDEEDYGEAETDRLLGVRPPKAVAPSPANVGTGTGLVMRTEGSRDDLTIQAARSPSESHLGPRAPSTDEMLALTQTYPIVKDQGVLEYPAGKKQKTKKRTHREKYGLVDGASLPATILRSDSHDSAGSNDGRISAKRSLSMDRKDLNEERLQELLHGLSYDHNA